VSGGKITIDDGQCQNAVFPRATLRLSAGVALFLGAAARAAVAVAQIAVVALFVVEGDAVPAARGAGLARGAHGLRLARRRAAVEGDVVAVVAAFRALLDAVAAGGGAAHAGVALALEAGFHAAALTATVAAFGVAVVAALVRIGDAVPAQVDASAGSARFAAHVARLDQVAGFGAAVAAFGVAVVARLA